MKAKTKPTAGGATSTSPPSPTIVLPAASFVVVSADGHSTRKSQDVAVVRPRRDPTWSSKKEAAAALVATLSRPTLYEMKNRGSGHGLAIRLRDGTTFYSKGWRMCSQGCRVPLDNWQHQLHYVEETRNGVIVKRYTCTTTTQRRTQ